MFLMLGVRLSGIRGFFEEEAAGLVKVMQTVQRASAEGL